MRPTLITGLGGTVGPALRQALDEAGRPCVGWDRAVASPDDPAAVEAHLDRVDPRAVCHLALGAEAWAAALAGWCARRGRPFVFTSTVLVFHHDPGGPHRPDDPPTARDEYGRYKARCEEAVRAANPAAIVARLGWQLAVRRGGNTMLEHLHARAAAGEALRASTRWVPATSFLADTAAALVTLLEGGAPGTFHVDGNAEAAWDFHRIVCALKARHGDPGWRIEPTDEPAFDQRLLDDRLRTRQITAWL